MEDNNISQSLSTSPERVSSSDQNKKSIGVFPRISLKKTLELASAVYELGQGEPVRRLRVFDYLKKSPASGPSRMLVTTSNMYGLTSGSYKSEYLTVSEKGRKLLEARSGKEKLNITFDILFENEIFQKFVDYWKDKTRPSDEISIDWLVRSFKFSNQDANSCWSIIKENLMDSDLIRPYSGKDVIVSREVALDSVQDDEITTELFAKSHVNEVSKDVVFEEKRGIVNAPKPFGSQIVERDFKYGRARLILPGDMTQDEVDKIKLLIDSMVTVVKE